MAAKKPKATQSRKTELAKQQKKFDQLNEESAVSKIVFRDGFRLTAKILIASLAINVILALAVFSFMTKEDPRPQIVGMDNTGRVTKITPLDEPNLSTAGLLNWAVECATESYTFDFLNYKTEINAAGKKCFTKDGFAKFRKLLVDGGTIKDTVDGKRAIKTVLSETPILRDQGVINNVVAWRIDIPVIISYEARGLKPQSRRHIISLTAVRTPETEFEKGVAIQKYLID